MARDYAKTTRNRSRRPAPKSGGGKLWLLAILLICLFVLGLAYLKQQAAHLIRLQTVKETVKTSTAARHPVASTTSPTSTQTHFDFYTLLPKTQVPAPREEATPNKPVTPPPSASALNTAENQQLNESSVNAANTATIIQSQSKVSVTTPPPTSNNYALQLGVFKDFASADELKAQVVLQGFEVTITPIKKTAGTLYRVWTGPYQSRVLAQQQQKNLQENQIKSEIIKQ